MRPATRHRIVLPLAAMLLFAGGPSAADSPPRRLVILATADLKGKTSPCGCHIPKGGLARLATFVDSTRAAGSPTLLLDAGGSFPEQDGRTELAEFMFASEVRGTSAMGWPSCAT